ncbi:MAG: hypothetical protein QXL17_02790 [Candidatus Thermoplasmatota archaeon]
MEQNQIIETKQTYFIPVSLLGSLQNRLDKLNKRGAKLGFPPVTLVEHSRKLEVVRGYQEAVDIGTISYNEAPKVEYIELSIKGQAPKIAGWTFIGKLDHHSLPGSVIVDTAPGYTIPKIFFEKAPICEHCGKERFRKDTFVLENDHHTYKQVGRNCLRDFLGYDPNGIVAYFSFFNDLSENLEKEENEFWNRGDRQDWCFNLKEVLANTVAVIRTYGWISRSLADEIGKTATADIVADLFAPTNSYNHDRIQTLREKIKFRPEEDKAETAAALAWLEQQKPSNEYMHNLIAIAKAGQITMKLFGYACSIIAAYQRATEKLRLNKTQNKINEYVGTVNEKIETTVTVIRMSYIDSFYGTVCLHKMLDDSGHTLVWFAHSESNMKEGMKYQIKGIVKEHNEYQNWKQTVLKRVKVTKELTDGLS